jgi:hypothetical protein
MAELQLGHNHDLAGAGNDIVHEDLMIWKAAETNMYRIEPERGRRINRM